MCFSSVFHALVLPFWTMLAQSWCILGPKLVHSWSKVGEFLVQSWCILGPKLVHSWCKVGEFLVQSWCILGAKLVHSWRKVGDGKCEKMRWKMGWKNAKKYDGQCGGKCDGQNCEKIIAMENAMEKNESNAMENAEEQQNAPRKKHKKH